MFGFLLIDKPAGLTSHGVVNVVRRLTGERRVGHAGTLDPFATGLLLIGVGRVATRELGRFVGLFKEYEATFVLGETSNTHDIDGIIAKGKSTSHLDSETLAQAMSLFLGPIDQIPPMHSAIKQEGKRLYTLAHAGKTVKRAARSVIISRFDLLALRPQNETLEIDVVTEVSSGTYIRALARDLGKELGVGGYVKTLRRTKIGPFSINESRLLPEASSQDSITLLGIDETLGRLLK